MFRYFCDLLIVISLSACTTATMVSSPGGGGHASLYAPINEASRGGVIKYLNNGADFVIRSRREDAYLQMYNSCTGSYRIDNEGPQAEGGTVIALSSSVATWGSYQYWYIQYSCTK